MKQQLLAWVGLALLIGGCVTPQIPLPPPGPGVLELGIVDAEAGTVQIKGKPSERTANTRVFIFNESSRTGVIVMAGADGSFATEPFSAIDGDRLEISYERDEILSTPICVEVDYDTASLPPCPSPDSP